MSVVDLRRASEEDEFHRHNFRVVTDAPVSSRPLPPLQGDLIIGYNVLRRVYIVSSAQSRFARDIQSFFRHVRGRGSSRDLSRRPDLSVVRWTLGLFRVWIVRQFVFVSYVDDAIRSYNWEVDEAQYSVTIVARAIEGPGYFSSSWFNHEVSVTFFMLY